MNQNSEIPRSFNELMKDELNVDPVVSSYKPDNPSGTQTPQGMLSFDELALKVEEYLPNTRKALKLLLAVATSGTRKNRVMLWLLLVGSPSSGKTDLVRLIKNDSSVVNLDNLTLNAFISGERATEKQEVYDLLPLLNGKCLVVKDWTVIFSLDEKACKKIIGDMVGAYDKSLSKHSSRRGHIEYESEFSHLGCITPATLNKHVQYLNMIGPRFLSYSIPYLSMKDEDKSFEAIFSNKDRQAEEGIARVTTSEFLQQLNSKSIDLIKPLNKLIQAYLKIASRFMARARGIVVIQASSFKDDTGKDITYYEPSEIQIEQPWRAVQQLITLVKYLALVDGREEVSPDDLEIIKGVVLSSMPADRAQALNVLKNCQGEITAKQLSEGVDRSTKTARRLLDEFTFLELVDKDKGTGTLASTYRIKEEYKTFITLNPAEFLSLNNKNTTGNDKDELIEEIFGGKLT